MEETIRFVILARSGCFTVTELCEQFGISRKTGFKHLERYVAEGMKGLEERSHWPHLFANQTDEAVEALILRERRLTISSLIIAFCPPIHAGKRLTSN